VPFYFVKGGQAAALKGAAASGLWGSDCMEENVFFYLLVDAKTRSRTYKSDCINSCTKLALTYNMR